MHEFWKLVTYGKTIDKMTSFLTDGVVSFSTSIPSLSLLLLKCSMVCHSSTSLPRLGGAENDGHEIAGHENGGQNSRTWKCKTGNCRTWKCRTWNCKTLRALYVVSPLKIRKLNDSRFVNKLNALLRYAGRQWIQKRSIGPARLCVRDNRNRTNNILESFHAALRRRIQVSQVSHSWDTCNTLRRSACTTWLGRQTVSTSDARRRRWIWWTRRANNVTYWLRLSSYTPVLF